MRAIGNILIGVLLTLNLWGQYDDEIVLNNPSFEEIPHKGGGASDLGIRGWYDCGEIQFPRETAPDIHPINAWDVEMPSSDGRTYLGMVVRDNDSWESVSQRMKQPLEEGKCYRFSVDLARSIYYVSGSRVTQQLENYTEPAVLRIWGGTGVCGRQELLGESTVIDNNAWETFEFEFEPGRNVNYFTLEAFYEVPVLIPYNGHVLLDNATTIEQIPCDDDEIFAVEEIKKEESKKNTERAIDRPKKVEEEIAAAPVVESTPEPRKAKLLTALDGATVKKGQTIRIENLYFAADSSKIESESYDVLEEVYDFLRDNRNIVVEIGGHTSTVPSHQYCNRLSSDRAKEVAFYLARMGISPKRLKYKGYGKRQPIVKNDKYDMEARQMNQRVEIKILSLDYSEATGLISNPNDSKSSQKDG